MKPRCTLIQEQMGKLFRCAEVGNYIRIRTPFMYPDGDYIDIFCERGSDEATITLSDLGETVRWLKMQTISPRRSPKQNQMIQDICLTHGVEFFRGMLQARYRPGDNLALAVTRISQAALRTADIWFTFRTRAVESATDEVAEYLTDIHIPYERNVTLAGRSGKSWPINFHTRTPRRSSLVHVLSTCSRGATRRITDHVVAAWHDLSQLKVGPEALHFVSLFDDTSDVWSDEDFRQLEDLSDIARWSEPDEFAQILKVA
ncbi:MAG: DUF1828 domain-containing protein [Planctomycetia bacterium]|nr:DUF1828 domain-containing protein [Planctomycetia bacterium]